MTEEASLLTLQKLKGQTKPGSKVGGGESLSLQINRITKKYYEQLY